MRSKVSSECKAEQVKDCRIKSLKKKEVEHTETEEALQVVKKEHDLWMYQNEKEDAKRLQGARKPRKDEEIAWAPPRNISKWPDWEGRDRGKKVNGGWKPEGVAKVPEILVVPDAVEGTYVALDGESRRVQVEAKLSRRGRERGA